MAVSFFILGHPDGLTRWHFPIFQIHLSQKNCAPHAVLANAINCQSSYFKDNIICLGLLDVDALDTYSALFMLNT